MVSELPGKAHTYGTDAGAAALFVRMPGQCHQPPCHWTRCVGLQCAEFRADTRTLEDRSTLVGVRHGAVAGRTEKA